MKNVVNALIPMMASSDDLILMIVLTCEVGVVYVGITSHYEQVKPLLSAFTPSGKRCQV